MEAEKEVQVAAARVKAYTADKLQMHLLFNWIH